MTIFFFTLIAQLGSLLPIRYFHTYKYRMFVGFLGKGRVREKERGEGQRYVFGGKPRKGIGFLALAK